MPGVNNLGSKTYRGGLQVLTPRYKRERSADRGSVIAAVTAVAPILEASV